MSKLTIEAVKAIFSYDPNTGVITRTKTGRKLEPADEGEKGLIRVFDNFTKKTYKLKLDKLAYMLAFGVEPNSNQRILHRNWNMLDNRRANLRLVTNKEYLKVKEAFNNLEHDIKLQANQVDQHCYEVLWKDKGIKRHMHVSDVVLAKKLVHRLRLKYSKILTNYCLFED